MPNLSDPSFVTLIAVEAALQAGNILKKGFGNPCQVSVKTGKHNMVTELDHAAENCIIDRIRSHFPNHGILAEESGRTACDSSNYLWVIDPLDGTLNFINNIPLFAVSIGIVLNEKAVAGVIYHPLTNELFIAQKDKGAYLNGTRLSVTNIDCLERAVISTGLPSNIADSSQDYLQKFAKIAKTGCVIRDIGSAALNLAYLAAGRFSAYWIDRLEPWDTAAGRLLVEEAGGKVSHYNGSPYEIFSNSSLLATNGFIHDELVSFLK